MTIEIVLLSIQHGDFPVRYVKLPGGISIDIPLLSHHYPIIIHI